MVIQSKDQTSNISFKHLVNIPRAGCIFGSARDRNTGKTQLFLIFQQKGRIYSRNGLKGTWEEVQSDASDSIREVVTSAVKNKTIPCYTTEQHYSLQN